MQSMRAMPSSALINEKSRTVDGRDMQSVMGKGGNEVRTYLPTFDMDSQSHTTTSTVYLVNISRFRTRVEREKPCLSLMYSNRAL